MHNKTREEGARKAGRLTDRRLRRRLVEDLLWEMKLERWIGMRIGVGLECLAREFGLFGR